MKLPFFRSKKYTDPLSVLQSETVGLTSSWHHGAISEGELVVGIGEELEKARQAIRKAIERAKPEMHMGIRSERNLVIEKYHASLLKELGLDE